MSELIARKILKSRKTYHCDYCGEIINRNESYEWSKLIHEGSFYEWRCHKACARIASAIWDYVDPDEGMSDQDFTDGCQEICQRFVCPDCPQWNKEYGDCDKDETYCIDRLDDFFRTRELYKAGRSGYAEIWKCREKRTEERRLEYAT